MGGGGGKTEEPIILKFGLLRRNFWRNKVSSVFWESSESFWVA